MACDTTVRQGQTLAQRASEVEAALRKLRADLLTGRVQIKIAPNGAIAFVGWADRADLTDACTFRVLSFQNAPELRTAVARAEAMQGRKVNPRAVQAGHHSHDGGRSWQKH
jgi:hypothetical protein